MDKDREDFDPNEWGNIELPGLSDEELHSKNWNKVDANRLKANDSKILKKISEGVKTYNANNSDAVKIRNAKTKNIKKSY